jgi:hypothetical protein
LSVGRGWQETSRLPEIQAQITAVTARMLVNMRGMLAWAEHVRTDNADLLRLEQEIRDLEAVQATRDASFNDWTGGHPCIGPVCFQARCMRLSGTGPCWIYEQKYPGKVEPA